MRTSQAKPRTLGNPYDGGVLSRKVSYRVESHSDLSPWWFVLLPEFSTKGLTFEGEVKKYFLLNCVLSELEPFVDDGVRLGEEEWMVHSSLCGFGVGLALHIKSNEGQGLKWLFLWWPLLCSSFSWNKTNSFTWSWAWTWLLGPDYYLWGWGESHTLEFSRC